jgi:hypothetical protein
MLFALKDHIQDLKTLEKVIKYYFKGDTKNNPKYDVLMELYGVKKETQPIALKPMPLLSVPPIALNKFTKTPKTLGAVYFYIDKNEHDILQSKCAFITTKKINPEGWMTFASEVFILENFNHVYAKLNDYQQWYEVDGFLYPKIKKYQVQNLKPIEAKYIFEFLTNQSFEALQKQPPIHSFASREECVELFENYCNVYTTKSMGSAINGVRLD